MKPLSHLIFGIIFSLILLIIFPKIGFFGFFIIFLSSVFIDVDHYLYYVLKRKNFNLKNSFYWYVNNGEKYYSFPESKRKTLYFGLCFLHGIEVIFLLFLLLIVFKNPVFLFLSTGFLFHQFIDFIDLNKKKLPTHKVLSFTSSILYAKNKNLPDEVI
jgi:hypothetical protein